MITIVSSNICPYCSAAKQLLDSKWVEYTEKTVQMWSPELMEIVQKTGLMTVPQIFNWEIARENLLGWYSEISELERNGKLDAALA